MKFASYFAPNGKASYGLVEGEKVFDLGLTRPRARTLQQFLKSSEFQKGSFAKGDAFALSSVTFLPVIPTPEKILCVGLNYENHRKETGRVEVGTPTIFARFANSQVGHGQAMLRPKVSNQFDFEAELAVIIGKSGKNISKANAFDHIAGYSCYNDGSIRDWQYHTHQYIPGKNFEKTGAFGPYLVTKDEVGALDNLKIQSRLNGETVQEATLGDMIFDIPTIIAYCSTFTRLEVGDVIATGTPGGVGAKRTPPLWMKAGDTIEISIERVGVLKNKIVDE